MENNFSQSNLDPQDGFKNRQEHLKREYQKAAKIHGDSVEALDLIKREKEDIDKEKLWVKAAMKGVYLIAQWGKFVTSRRLKSLDKKVTDLAQELQGKFDQLLQDVDEKEAVYQAHCLAGAKAEEGQAFKESLEQAIKRLKDFSENNLVYRFSDAELKQREKESQKKAVASVKYLLEPLIPQPVEGSWTALEREYLNLNLAAKQTRSYASLFENSSTESVKMNPSVAAEIREASNDAVDAEVRLREFLADHPDIEEQVRNKARSPDLFD